MNGTIGRRTGGFGFLVGGLFAVALSAQTADYHVAKGHPDASDENPGTQAAPFRTIQAAVDIARAGDTIWVKEGFYEEPVVISSHGRRAHPITLAAWKDDRVRMGSRPQDLPGPEAWTPIEGTKSWQLEMPEGTPDDLIVLFDGAAQPCEIRPEPPREDQVLWSTYDPATRRLKVNAGGPNPAERHELTLARDLSGIVNFTLDSAHWVLRGFEFGYARNFIVHFGHNILIEDCHFHHAYRSAIFGTGYLSRIRRSIRRYADRAIPDEVLQRVLDAARRAPSGNNRQPWCWVVVRNPDRRQAIAHACYAQSFIAEAPVVIVCCAIPYACPYAPWHADAYLADLVIAVDHLVLAARAEGLASCWVGAIHDDAVRAIIDAPVEAAIRMVVPMGYPASESAFHSKAQRRPLTAMVFAETFGSNLR